MNAFLRDAGRFAAVAIERSIAVLSLFVESIGEAREMRAQFAPGPFRGPVSHLLDEQ
jgi:hypothetical protein